MMAKRILLCDDEIHILRAAEFKFKRSGYEVLLAGDGEEAWQILQSSVPDIIVTDCQMPRLSGLELAQRIKNDPRLADVPVVMLSGKGFELSSEEIRTECGIRALIGKPFSPRELFEQVESIVSGDEACLPAAAAAAQPWH